MRGSGFRGGKHDELIADPKTAWTTRWVDNGGTLVDGRMIALKTDDIWAKISRFATPWPPYDFQSGMGLHDISHREAADLGLITFGQRLAPVDVDFNQELKASVRGLSDRYRRALETIFEGQINIDGNEVRWNSHTAHEAARTRDRETARRIARGAAEDFGAVRHGDAGNAGLEGVSGAGEAAERAAQVEREYAAQIAAVAIGRKPLFHEQIFGAAELVAGRLRGAMGAGVETRAIDGHLYVWRPDTLPVSIEEAHRLSLAGENGELLGYGSRTMFEQGNVEVVLKNEAGDIVGGFRSPKAEATKWARRRANDYAIAWDEPITAEVGS